MQGIIPLPPQEGKEPARSRDKRRNTRGSQTGSGPGTHWESVAIKGRAGNAKGEKRWMSRCNEAYEKLSEGSESSSREEGKAKLLKKGGFRDPRTQMKLIKYRGY